MIALARDMKRKFEQLIGMPGIAETSIQLLAEFAGLAPERTVRQWVAYCTLNPAHQLSGMSAHRPSRPRLGGMGTAICSACPTCRSGRRGAGARTWRPSTRSFRGGRRISFER